MAKERQNAEVVPDELIESLLGESRDSEFFGNLIQSTQQRRRDGNTKA